ncbi:MAG TPA: phosphatidylinositol mannoside acyltransferase [Pseudonocardiaceae bacterium]|jgi:KDO2-lipid IV(A) lauroyltransferase|nr:phosphatidylinositol mannoside acyltransferase [Pseudonocardiaceae bacterium]
MSRLTEALSGVGYRAAWKVVRLLPESVARGLFEAGADRAARRNKAGTQQLRRNLARVMPRADDAELDELTRQALRSYARYWCEAFRLPAMDLDALFTSVDPMVTGQENLDAALAEGNGAIVALPHCGNFDVSGVWTVRHCGQFTTVAQRLKPESLFRRFTEYRESLGIEILPLTGGERSTARILIDRLRANRVICLVSDRDITDNGVPVTFFGEQTTMPAGPARLSAVTGAALLPVGSWFTDDGWGFRIHPPIRVSGRAGVAAATQALADVFAGDIAAHPTDWHMMQPLWPADLPGAQAPVLAARTKG